MVYFIFLSVGGPPDVAGPGEKFFSISSSLDGFDFDEFEHTGPAWYTWQQWVPKCQ